MAFKRSVTDKKIIDSLLGVLRQRSTNLPGPHMCSMQFAANATRGQYWPGFSGLFLPLWDELRNSGIL